MNNFKIYRDNGKIHFELSGSAPIIAVVVLVPLLLIIGIYNLFLGEEQSAIPMSGKPKMRQAKNQSLTEHPAFQPWPGAVVMGSDKYKIEWLSTYRTKFKGLPYYKETIVFTHPNTDVSLSIEDDNDDFMGEWGASIHAVGTNMLPTVINIWLFDKEDFMETLNVYIYLDNKEMVTARKNDKTLNLSTGIHSAVLNTGTLSMLIDVVEYSSTSQSDEVSYPKEISTATIRVTIAPKSNMLINTDDSDHPAPEIKRQ